jgi:2'-5' RNA ligase
LVIALDVAILPPPDISRRAIELSAKLPQPESVGVRLGGDMLPHITLTQQFVESEGIDTVLDRVASALAGVAPLRLTVTGAGRGRSSVWMAIQPTPVLIELHQRLMDSLREFERSDGTQAAFINGDARPGDLEWVAGFRRNSSYEAFTPHITLGHAATLPSVEPVTFDATTVAACHLGRFCTCRRVLRQWKL